MQACADDPQVAVHAIRNLSRIAFGSAALRWAQLGFGRTSSTSTSQQTPRNLFGFKDGTANLKAEEPAVVDDYVWVGDADDDRAPVARRRVLPGRPPDQHDIETWDRTSLREQESSSAGTGQGAPLSGATSSPRPTSP